MISRVPSEARNAATRRVMTTIGFLPAGALPVSDSGRRHRIVVAMHDEPYDELRAWLDRLGGEANLFIAFEDHFELVRSPEDRIPLMTMEYI